MSIFKITLDSGRVIEAAGFHIERTYEGWVDGVPTAEWNDGLLKGSPKRLKGLFFDWPVYIVEPTRTTREELSLHGCPNEFLPNYWFTAKFYSSPIGGRNGSIAERSHLIISWFQEEALPIPSDSMRQALRNVPWHSTARNDDPWE